jgi:hypothetical protein
MDGGAGGLATALLATNLLSASVAPGLDDNCPRFEASGLLRRAGGRRTIPWLRSTSGLGTPGD